MTDFTVTELGPAQLMLCLLFGTNALIFCIFQGIKYTSPKSSDVTDGKKVKVLSKPFLGTVECFSNLTAELFKTGLIMAMTYMCEKHWFYAHSTKSYNRDLFFFVLIIFFAYAYYTIKPIHDLTLLGREQTEEWKGWMQFIFLLYHYFNAHEVYNSVRVMITCYVWMTGFGNFSFFYIKQDFGWLRVTQMMWRLNFSVLLLMWTHSNTYILYYICPMHTFYFLMVYATMYLFSSVNNTKWGIRIKLLVLAIIIYIVWDVNGGIFDYLFAWLGTDKVIGAKSGSVWEYYFRTSLDHWSSFLGMIFALNFPLAEQFFTKAKRPSLLIAAVLMGGLAIWWVNNCFWLEKTAYNLSHSYLAIIPLTAYIFFRNITPAVRSGVSMSLHDLGKTTLETYLLQHHIWLTSNAKTLLTLTPGHPWINFALCTIMFFVVSKELYRLTMTLRGMILPEDKNIAFTNMIGTGAVLMVLYLVASVLHALEPSIVGILLTCVTLLLMTLLLINRFAKSCSDHHLYRIMSSWAMRAAVIFILVVGGLQIGGVFGSSSVSSSSSSSSLAAFSPTAGLSAKSAYVGNTPHCLKSISAGHWASSHDGCGAGPLSKTAVCRTDKWEWLEKDCPVTQILPPKSQQLLQGKSVSFVGDSVVRNSYHKFLLALDPNYKDSTNINDKHMDLSFRPEGCHCTVHFKWAPFLRNITDVLKNTADNQFALVVAGGAHWDALHIRDLGNYRTVLEELGGLARPLLNDMGSSKGSNTSDTSGVTGSASVGGGGKTSTVHVWLLPTRVVDNLLQTTDKKTYMSNVRLDEYRQLFVDSKAASVFNTLVDPSLVVAGKEGDAVDGIHFSSVVYEVIAQMLLNAYAAHVPSFHQVETPKAKPYVPRATGSMSNPYMGAGMLVLTCVMLFLMDSWLGFGFFALAVCGQNYDWDAAYKPLHNKIESGLRKERTKSRGSNADEEMAEREKEKDIRESSQDGS